MIDWKPRMKWPDEMRDYLAEIVPGRHYHEIVKMFNEKFGLNLSQKTITSAMKRYNLFTGFDGRFPKGNVPLNKGKKMSPEQYEKCKATMFKPGIEPTNHREVGSERNSKDGYIEIKTAEPGTWELKHRVVWQQAYGEIPEGKVIIFKDGNKLNCALENLEIISQRENAFLNLHHLRSDNPEVTECGVLVARVHERVQERRKE